MHPPRHAGDVSEPRAVARDDRHGSLHRRHAGHARRRSASPQLRPWPRARRDLRGREGAWRDAGAIAAPRRQPLAHRDAARGRACGQGAARDQRLYRRSLAGAPPHHRAGVFLDRRHRAAVRRGRALDHADAPRALRERPHHRLLPHRPEQPPVDGRPRPDALDQLAERRRLSHALRRAAMAAAQGRRLDPWLEQPARHHQGPLSACARAGGEHPDLARLQRPRRRALDRDGRAARAPPDRRCQGRDRHARHRHQADPDACVLAGRRDDGGDRTVA